VFDRDFTSKFRTVKKLLREVFRRAVGRKIPEDIRPILSQNGQLRIVGMGEAKGLLDSAKRHA